MYFSREQNSYMWSHHISTSYMCQSSWSSGAWDVLQEIIYTCTYCDPATLLSLYTSLNHWCLEYTCPVWSPHTSTKSINQLKHVKKFGLRLVMHEWKASNNNDLLSNMNIPTLERRRIELSLCLLYITLLTIVIDVKLNKCNYNIILLSANCCCCCCCIGYTLYISYVLCVLAVCKTVILKMWFLKVIIL